MIQSPIPVVIKTVSNADPARAVHADSLGNCTTTATRIGFALIMTPDASQKVTNLVGGIIPSRPREPGNSVTFKEMRQLPHEVLLVSEATLRLKNLGSEVGKWELYLHEPKR